MTIAQDDIRQNLIVDHCGLINSSKRYGADAFDELGNEFEIKSGTTKDYISTARDFGFNILNEYRKKYWIIASGVLDFGKVYTMTTLYIAHPDNLNFFFNEIEQTLNKHQNVVDIITEANIPMSIQQKKLMDKILKRGITLNDPRINMKHVHSNCKRIDHLNSYNAALQVRDFVKNNPIVDRLPKESNEENCFFYYENTSGV